MSETGDQNQDGTSESVDSSTSLPVCTQPSPTFLPQPIAQINIPHHGSQIVHGGNVSSAHVFLPTTVFQTMPQINSSVVPSQQPEILIRAPSVAPGPVGSQVLCSNPNKSTGPLLTNNLTTGNDKLHTKVLQEKNSEQLSSISQAVMSDGFGVSQQLPVSHVTVPCIGSQIQQPFVSQASMIQGIQPTSSQAVTFQVFSQTPLGQPGMQQIVSQAQQQVFTQRAVMNIGTPVQVCSQSSLFQPGNQTQAGFGSNSIPFINFPYTASVRAIAPKPSTGVCQGMNVNRNAKLPVPTNISTVPSQGSMQIHVPILQQNSGVQNLFTTTSSGQGIPQGQQFQFHSQIQSQNQPSVSNFVPASNISQQSTLSLPSATSSLGPVFVISQTPVTYFSDSRNIQMPSLIVAGSNSCQGLCVTDTVSTHLLPTSASKQMQPFENTAPVGQETERKPNSDKPKPCFEPAPLNGNSKEPVSTSAEGHSLAEFPDREKAAVESCEINTLHEPLDTNQFDDANVDMKVIERMDDSTKSAGQGSAAVTDEILNTHQSTFIENFHESVLKLKSKKKLGNNRDSSLSGVDQKSENVGEQKEVTTALEAGPVTSDSGYRDSKVVSDIEADSQCKDSEEKDEEEVFIWEKYLEQTGCSAVPATAFKHVENSLQSGFVQGMKLEVPNRADPSTYWVATVVTTCGPLLRLRYDAYKDDDPLAEFWCDRATADIHQIGWCALNGKNLEPPEDIRDTVTDWHEHLAEILTGARTAPQYLLEKGAGSSPVDQLKCSMRLELQDVLNPVEVWIVQILENVGGRLYLRLEGTESASKHFWMFYLNPRLHYIGWATEQGYTYKPPQDIFKEHTEEQWTEILSTALKDSKEDLIPEGIFREQAEPKPHSFTEGMKLEALIPGANAIGPATVTKVINEKYFIVEIDDVRSVDKRESIKLCCHSEYLGIFPVSWCQCKGIRLMSPPGWKSSEFVWGEYLNHCSAKAAPEKLFNSGTDEHEFERGMKLEAVNPVNPNQICAATITKIAGPLLWVHLDHMRDIPSHIEDIDSHRLFPVGWCESNNFQLKPPIKARRMQKKQSDLRTEEVYRLRTANTDKEPWCPKIYFNHRCFSGPYLSKGRMADLPKSVGPGPLVLVLKEVLGLLINVAYKSCRALKEIQLEGSPNPHMESCVLKAKYKGKKYKGLVEVCKNEELCEEYCRNICIKLECCPYIISPLFVADYCPENCQQMTKTKYHYNYAAKKKKPGQMLASAKPVLKTYTGLKRGRKKKSFLLTHKKRRMQGAARPYIPVGERDNYIDYQDDEGFIDGDDEYDHVGNKRKHSYKSYDIQTRGAKLPKYSFERRTHKKIFQDPVEERRKVFHSHGARPEHVLQPREGSMKLKSNPLLWSVGEVVQYIKATDCSHLARILKEQDIDGQAFLLLDLATLQEHLELKLGPAVKLCHQIERLKVAFFEQYA